MDNKKEDWHIHSIYSGDSIISPERMVDIAIKKGLRRICVTDHNTIKGGVMAKKYAQGKDIEVVVGAEIKTDKGEIIGLWLKDEIKSRKLIEVIKEIKGQGGKILIPHPYGSIRQTKRTYKLEEIALYADYIETYNGRSFLNFSANRERAIIERFNLRGVFGSDAHFAFEIGNTSKLYLYKGIVGFIISGILNLILLRNLKRN